jgi:DNA-binding NarL/FixJ family response regulator
MNVLIVSKNVFCRMRIEILMKNLYPDSSILVVPSLLKAHDIIKTEKIEFIFLDIDVPTNMINKVKIFVNRSIYQYKTKIIGLTYFDEVFFPVHYFSYNLSAYLHKESSRDEIFIAVSSVLKGLRYINDKLNHVLVNYVTHNGEKSILDSLNPFELLVVQEILKGKNYFQVASSMNTTKTKIEVILNSVYDKLKIQNGNFTKLLMTVNEIIIS